MSLIKTAEERRSQYFQDLKKHLRGKCVQVVAENGKPVEYLMVKCENCGQPRRSQRVLRFNERELREWPDEYLLHFTKMDFLDTLLVSFMFIVICFTMWQVTSSIFYMTVTVAATLAFCYLFLHRNSTQRDNKIKKIKEKKRQILARHGNIPVDAVSTDNWHRYIILPEEQGKGEPR